MLRKSGATTKKVKLFMLFWNISTFQRSCKNSTKNFFLEPFENRYWQDAPSPFLSLPTSVPGYYPARDLRSTPYTVLLPPLPSSVVLSSPHLGSCTLSCPCPMCCHPLLPAQGAVLHTIASPTCTDTCLLAPTYGFELVEFSASVSVSHATSGMGRCGSGLFQQSPVKVKNCL